MPFDQGSAVWSLTGLTPNPQGGIPQAKPFGMTGLRLLGINVNIRGLNIALLQVFGS